MDKGSFGYLDKKKKKQLIISFFSLLMVSIICITGIVIYNTNKSIYAVLAALASLPAAKMLVGYFVLMPYKSVKEDVKNRLNEIAGNDENYVVIYDALLASTNKSMYAGTIYIKNGKIIALTDYYKNNTKTKLSTSDIEKHIKFIVDANCNYSVIKVYSDEAKFYNAVKAEAKIEVNMNEEELEKMKRMNEKIAAQIKIYIF